MTAGMTAGMTAALRAARRILDALYLAGGALGALCLLAILVIICVQVGARWSGGQFPGAADYAGYCMAAASFFAMAHALDHGAHIRVTLLLHRLGRFRRWGEAWCFAVGAGLSSWFAFYAWKAVYWSRKLNDVSQGQDATPLWIPQIAMAAGVTLLAIAFCDYLLRILFAGGAAPESDAIDQSHGE